MLDTRRPVPGRDYPTSREALLELTRSELDCRDYLERVCWPDGFVCPACQARDVPWRSGTGLVACRHCREPVILTRDTPFHSATIPLSRWLLALWEVCERETIDEAHVRRTVGLTSATDAASFVAALRSAMALANRRPLSGVVQLGHSGLTIENRSADGGKRWTRKVQLAIVIELLGGEPRAARVRSLRRHQRMAVLTFARQSVSAEAEVSSPGLGDAAVQRVASLIELWLDAQTDVSDESLDAVLCEFCFRFERRAQPRGRAFHDLLLACLLLARAAHRPGREALTGS